MNVGNTIKVSQWRNTVTVMDWLKSLSHVDKSHFAKFNIVEHRKSHLFFIFHLLSL